MRLQEIPFAEVARIYEEQAKDRLPLTEQEFREVISAEYMVFGRMGLGEPQVIEIKRMFSNLGNQLSNYLISLPAQTQTYTQGVKYLEDRFKSLVLS